MSGAIERCIESVRKWSVEYQDGKTLADEARAELAELRRKADRLENILEALNDAIEECHTSEVQKGWIMDKEIRDIIANSRTGDIL